MADAAEAGGQRRAAGLGAAPPTAPTSREPGLAGPFRRPGAALDRPRPLPLNVLHCVMVALISGVPPSCMIVSMTALTPAEESAALEQEVERARDELRDLERSLRAVRVEAQAAVDPAQFREALLARRPRPGSVLGPIGFCVGITVGTTLVAVLGSLLSRLS